MYPAIQEVHEVEAVQDAQLVIQAAHVEVPVRYFPGEHVRQTVEEEHVRQVALQACAIELDPSS